MLQHIQKIYVVWNTVRFVNVMSVDFPVIVPPSGLLEACHEIAVEAVDVGELVIVVPASSAQQLTPEES